MKRVNRLVRDQESPTPFAFHNYGSFAYIGNWSVSIEQIFRSLDFYWGNRKAIYDRPSAEGSEDGITGRLAWLLWRSAYFTMTLSVRNK